VYVFLCYLYGHILISVYSTPETFDIVQSTLSAAARKNLAEISKVLTQISSGQLFGDNDPCLTPINSFVGTAINDFSKWFLEGIKHIPRFVTEIKTCPVVANVADADAQFHANEFLDVTVQPRPVYISPNEVYSLHSLLAQNLDKLVRNLFLKQRWSLTCHRYRVVKMICD